ncbi:hypothetical protein E3P91_03964 [Wallemia ichthyophaga]|nr:hypothetical protein E3P91_03964 [Wallemia ichthyophaga]TIB58728.1 hypothetical protein E3P78_03824 [Wallemia ichthyophaga]
MGNQSSSIEQTWFHVVRVRSNSPAFKASIEPFFDFITCAKPEAADGEELADKPLQDIVQEHKDRRVNITIWSSKRQTFRDVSIVPSIEWNEIDDSLLGLTLRACDANRAMSSALDNVWHILEVITGSPAESAGLVPYGDWVIGWPGGVLRQENDFYDLVEMHTDKPLRLYVYSFDFDTLREVVLVPNRQWGGEGLLGCGVGFGLLHQIPVKQD